MVPGLHQVDTRPTAVAEPRYKVEAVRFEAIDETGFDGPFVSDEVFAVVRDEDRHELSVSRVFDDVDAGERATLALMKAAFHQSPGLYL